MSVNVTLPVQGTRMYQSAVIRTFGNSSKSGWHLVPGIRRESVVESLTPIFVPPTSPKKNKHMYFVFSLVYCTHFKCNLFHANCPFYASTANFGQLVKICMRGGAGDELSAAAIAAPIIE